MTNRIACSSILIAAASLAVTGAATAQIDTTFTYQGRLDEAGAPANGAYDLHVSLWDALLGGSQIGSTMQFPAWPVSDGVVTLGLDFGAAAFDDTGRYLQVAVNGTTLVPRQVVTRAPYAIQTRGIYVNPSKSFVGIGRTTPITAAEVFGLYKDTASYGGMYVETSGQEGRPFYGYSAGGDIDAYHYFDAPSDQWRLYTGGERLVVDRSTGNVGIGTTEPVTPLHVEGSDSYSTIFATNSDPTGVAITGQNEASTSTTPAISGVTGGTTGTGLYGYCWSVQGQSYGVYGRSNSTTGYDFFAGGAGTNYGSTSSIRWKHNVVSIPRPLDMIARLRGVYFDWDDAHGGHHDVGMIAEEVGRVLPEVVVYEADGIDAEGMDYSKLTPLLVEAVNALRAEKDADVEALRAEKDAAIAELRRRVGDLEALVERLAGGQ